MANPQHIRPNPALMARLHAACMDSSGRNGAGKPAAGDYLVEGQSPKGSTLGSSINYNPANA